MHDAASCAAAIADCRVAVNCSGPFVAANTALLEACLSQQVHYCDISDDRPYCQRVRQMGRRFLERDLTAGWGLSSLPGISGALAVALTAARHRPFEKLRNQHASPCLSATTTSRVARQFAAP